jgi:uncharacterized protein (TIGR02996 family)
MAKSASPYLGGPSRREVLALLAAVKEAPEEDAPRLVLADWLEEQGDPRGELLRVQCELGRWGEEREAWGNPRRQEMIDRQAELLSQHGAEWRGAFEVPGANVKLERGLLRLRLSARTFLTRQRQKLAGTEMWGWVESLELAPGFVEALEAIATAPALADLVGLDLTYGNIGPEGARTLLSSPHLERLKLLNLYSNNIGPEGAAALAGAGLGGLLSLRLTWNGVGDKGAVRLAKAPFLGQLTTLALGVNEIRPAGLYALVSSPHLTRLRRFEPGYNELGDRGVWWLAESPYLSELEVLDLSCSSLGDEGVVALAGASLPRLRVLGLQNNAITAAGAKALVHSPLLAHLSALDLNDPAKGAGIGDEGASALANARGVAGLASLGLRQNGIGARGAIALAESPHLSDRARLDLWGNDVGDAGRAALNSRFGYHASV